MEDRGRLLEEMLLSSPDALVVVGGGGTIEFASPAAETLFGYEPEELVGRPIETLIPLEFHEVHRHHRSLYAEAPEGRPMGIGLDLKGQHRDGSVFPVDVSLVPVGSGPTLRVGAFVRDATERRRGEDLLRFVNEISRGVISGEPVPDLLHLTARRARVLVGAAAAWISVESVRRDKILVAAADGVGAEGLRGASVPAVNSLAARAMLRNETVIVPDMAGDPAVVAEARAAGFGPGMYIPMQAEDAPVGTLILARSHGGEDFGAAEVSAAQVFASAAAITLALGRAREAIEEMRISSEHERIARDLHDTVIQRLFGLGMRLQAAERLAEGVVAERIRSTVDSIDEVIREIRQTIFDLNRPASIAGDTSVRDGLETVVEAVAADLGLAPRLAFRGPVESAVGESLLVQLQAVLREALSNVARHARAAAVDVVLTVADGYVSLSVADDGAGIPDHPAAGHGLANMASRAEKLGGRMQVSGRTPSGTVVDWRVPYSGDHR